MDDIKLLKDALPEMAAIINAESGQIFALKDSDTLLILQRRIGESDLQKALATYNGIFAMQHGADVKSITDSAVAFVKIKVLLDAGIMDFDAFALRSLIKECHTYIDKTTNIVRLSKTHGMTADDFQKEKINQTIAKNEALITALKELVENTEKSIERIPKSIDEEPEEPVDSDDGDVLTVEEKPAKELKAHHTVTAISDKFSKLISSGRDKRQVEERLKNAEKESSSTMCVEIPFYDDRLVATEVISCKDLEHFVLLKRKENVYFGLKANLKGNTYNNKDRSLMELTEISDDFVQFMAEDLLDDAYELRPFTKEEKKSLQMYFNFVSGCFEKYIGVSLTVAEYLEFKRYYNRLVCKALHLEDEEHRAYYRALPIAELYMAVMDSYNMVYSDSKQRIIKAIIDCDSQKYVDDLLLIMKHHIVDDSAKDELQNLIEQFIYFGDESHFEEKESEDLNADKKVEVNVVPQIPMYQNLMIPQIGNMYFTLQCLNENREIVDEAYFSTGNMSQAMEDYKSKDAYMKRIGLVQDGRFVPLLSTGGFQDEK